MPWECLGHARTSRTMWLEEIEPGPMLGLRLKHKPAAGLGSDFFSGSARALGPCGTCPGHALDMPDHVAVGMLGLGLGLGLGL